MEPKVQLVGMRLVADIKGRGDRKCWVGCQGDAGYEVDSGNDRVVMWKRANVLSPLYSQLRCPHPLRSLLDTAWSRMESGDTVI